MGVYKAGIGASYTDEKAQALGEVMEKLGQHVQPQDIVNAAKPKKSPIHDLFDWDDTHAANAHRLAQARHHIARLRIVVKTPKGYDETKAFHSVRVVVQDADKNEETRRGYSPLNFIREEEDLVRQVLDDAKSELDSWRKRYKEYSNLFGDLFEVIDTVLEAA